MMKTLGSVHNQVGESPLWSVAEQALYWVDIEGRRLHRFDWITGAEQSWATVERIACIALHAEGGLVAGMDTGIFHLQPQSTGSCAIECLFTAQFPREGMRFNDGRCDRDGRFWVTSMVRDMALAATDGALYCCNAQGISAPLVNGLVTGNGLGFSPDGSTLYLSDSHPTVRQLWAFDLDSKGALSNRRLFADIQKYAGRPDGAAVDADGGYWICGNDGGQVHRFMPDGRHDRSLNVPVSKPSMCAFGGPEMDQLFITSIKPAKPVAGFDAALDGAVFITQPGVKGLPETPYYPRETT
jgi:sugar lactone lactonase YvrE